MSHSNQVTIKNILQKRNFSVYRKIGKGGFGYVFLASRFNNCMSFYAVKCISLKNTNKDSNFKKQIQQQAKIMQLVNHSNVVGFQTSFQDSGWYFIVMEYCDLGNLMAYQTKNNNKYLKFSEACKFILQILHGLQSIHQRNIIHRDIKCQNILLKKNKAGSGFQCKIADFGFAQIIMDNTKAVCGTTYYMAPQILKNLPYRFQADIWSVGVVFYYMLFGEFPFKGANMEKQFIQKCGNGFKLTQIPQHLKSRKQLSHIEDFFYRTFDLSQTTRITLQQMIDHPIFKTNDGQGTEDSFTDQKLQEDLQLCLNKVKFVQDLMSDLTKLMFVDTFLFYSARFYLIKIILSILGHQDIKNYVLDQPKNKFCIQVKKKLTQYLSNLPLQVQIIKKFANETKKINNFDKGVNIEVQDFYSIKQPYRNTLALLYSQVSKKLINNQQLKYQLKLRVLCCHLLNRIFNQGFRKDIFPNFLKWYDISNVDKKEKKQHIQFSNFNKWLKSQSPERIAMQIQNINNKFYN